MKVKHKMKKKYMGILNVTIFILFVIIFVGPIDGFRRGYYCEVVDYDQIALQDRLGYVDLSWNFCSMCV